jgi:hypothetical protein
MRTESLPKKLPHHHRLHLSPNSSALVRAFLLNDKRRVACSPPYARSRLRMIYIIWRSNPRLGSVSVTGIDCQLSEPQKTCRESNVDAPGLLSSCILRL